MVGFCITAAADLPTYLAHTALSDRIVENRDPAQFAERFL